MGEIRLFILLTASPLPQKTSWITYTVCAAEWDYTFVFLYCTLNMVRVYSYYKYIFIKINLTKVVSSCISWILLRETSMQFALSSEKIQTVLFWQKLNSRCSSIKSIWENSFESNKFWMPSGWPVYVYVITDKR